MLTGLDDLILLLRHLLEAMQIALVGHPSLIEQNASEAVSELTEVDLPAFTRQD